MHAELSLFNTLIPKGKYLFRKMNVLGHIKPL